MTCDVTVSPTKASYGYSFAACLLRKKKKLSMISTNWLWPYIGETKNHHELLYIGSCYPRVSSGEGKCAQHGSREEPRIESGNLWQFMDCSK